MKCGAGDLAAVLLPVDSAPVVFSIIVNEVKLEVLLYFH